MVRDIIQFFWKIRGEVFLGLFDWSFTTLGLLTSRADHSVVSRPSELSVLSAVPVGGGGLTRLSPGP